MLLTQTTSVCPFAPDLAKHLNIVQQDGLKHQRPTNTSHDPNNGLWSIKEPQTRASETDTSNTLEAYLHLPHGHRREAATTKRSKTAVILISDASGDTAGPSAMYTSMAEKLASVRRGTPVLRMGNRVPACKASCIADVLAAMDYLQHRLAVGRYVLVGWNHGSAPAMTVGGLDNRVVGCATVASRTADSDVVKRVAEKSLPLLLLHARSDEIIPPSCSKRLLKYYQRHAKEDMGFLKLFDSDDHVLTENSAKAEAMLCDFVTRCAGVELAKDEAAIKKCLVSREKVSLMVESGEAGEA